ncbi:PTS fructose transporter subunit IIABC [Bacillus fonticola]|uniref:PTS fructose transporter subunit IIABC n=1 Tax=Bacillus fonticola TaxID=2728853 RepID=UPI0014732850|nr:fructose-specific PTS transporter subunit EIIC [Bacillus fonticola]
MNITDLLAKECMILDVQAQSKEAVLEEMATKLEKTGRLNDRKQFLEAIHARESQSTTGVGDGIAIPHAKTAAVKTPTIVFARSKHGIDYDSLDGQPAHLFFMIAATDGANDDHLAALSSLSSYLMDGENRRKLMEADTKSEVTAIFSMSKESDEDTSKTEGLVLAVTACPTGIAHTYMAADALKAKAKELGIGVKVETNGSDGVRNELTEEDIAQASAIIVAADKQVDMARFHGRKVIEVPVAKAIREPEQLLTKAAKGDAPVYSSGDLQGDVATHKSKEKRGRVGFYKHLMNGVSNMLPFVVGGGLLIAISFIWGINSANPDSAEYNEFAALLNSIGGEYALGLMVVVLSGFIAQSIADRPGLAPGMVGGLMAATGGAGFLGGIISGFLAGYLIVFLKYAFRSLPKVLEGLKPVLLYPFFGILLTGLIMSLLVGPLSSITSGLENFLSGLGTGNLILLGVILGAMMAFDMGGPLNKTAFAFGIALIDAGNYAPHAAVMAGGMVPPIGLALATTLFKSKFTSQERKAGVTAYFLGASFITEGAIPFAVADPGRVIPSIVTGSAVAGGLAMAFGNGLQAPHGGLFVIPFVQGNPLLYILAILIGSLVTAIMVGLLKKKVPQ